MSVNGLGGPYGSAYSSATYISVSGLGQSASTDTQKAGSSATPTSSNSVVVNISANGKAASAQATEQLSFEDVGKAARAKLDALIQRTAQKAGISPNAVNVQAIQVSEYSDFSDQELAAMSLNSSKNFSVEERDEAQGVLAARMATSLEPYQAATNAGDRRGHAMAINALYDKMSPEVRSALGWTPTMMAANNKMLHGDEERFCKLEFAGIFSQLQHAALLGGLSLNAGKQAVAQDFSLTDVGSLARKKLDVLREQAAKKTNGTASTVNIQKVDYSSFSDQELAAMAKNSSGNFTEEEQIHAQGWLNERLRVSLEPYRAATNAGDRRGHAMAINALYDKMSPEVRSVLGWTPTMMASNNEMLVGDQKRLGKLDISGILTNLRSAQVNGGLTFDASV